MYNCLIHQNDLEILNKTLEQAKVTRSVLLYWYCSYMHANHLTKFKLLASNQQCKCTF